MDLFQLQQVCQRVLQKHHVVDHHHYGDHQSPLVAMDDAIAKNMLTMTWIWQCLSPSPDHTLVNSLIEGQPSQQQLIEWKRKNSSNEISDTVGEKYWRDFMKINRHRIVTCCGQKYELDIHNFPTYKNFRNMYKHTNHEMVEAGVAQRLPTCI